MDDEWVDDEMEESIYIRSLMPFTEFGIFC